MNCNSCGAEIKFIKTKNREGQVKSHPVNYPPQKLLVPTNEEIPNDKFESGKERLYRVSTVYVSHFSTCPNADDHRRKS